MDSEIEATNAYLFAYYAGNEQNRWKKLKNWPVQHRRLGRCRLVDVTNVTGHLILYFEMDSDDPSCQPRKFPIMSFANYFEIETLPGELVGFEEVRIEAIAQYHLAQERKREAEEQEEKKRKAEIERQTRLEEELRQKEREAEDKKHFADLREKYKIGKTKEIEPTSPLFPILLQLEEGKWLGEDALAWLEKGRFNSLLAEIHRKRYMEKGDGWDLVKAGKYFRYAKQPEMVIEMVDSVVFDDPELQAALLTNHGGAFRDIKELEKAKECANEAIKLQPNSFYQYNLLGAICYQQGEPEAGDIHFQRAIELGSTPTDQDKRIRQAFNYSEDNTKKLVSKYLLQKDPERYKWAKYHLKE